MLTTYRRVLSLPGALAFSLSGVVGRLPISMVSLGIVLLVSTRTGSYGLAGAVSAAYVLAQALLSVPQGRFTDRFGQGRVLPIGALVFTVALALMMWAVEAGWGTPVPHVFAALAGAALPQVGASVRARWSRLAPDRTMLQTAFAVEAVMDEAVFMVGPTVVTLLATAVHPLAGLGTAIVAGLAGTLALAAQTGTEPPRHPRHPVRAERPRMPWSTMAPLIVAAAAIGAVFGSVEVVTVAFAEELGAKTVSGLLLAIWALGSLVSGLVTGAVSWRATNAVRLRRGTLALAVSVVPLPFLVGFPLMAAVLLVAGFAISPTLIAMTALVEEVVPASRLTEGMSIVHTGMAAGIAPGAAVAGLAIDRWGASPSYWVAVAAGAVGVVAAFTAEVRGQVVTRRESVRPGPIGSSE